MKKRTFLALSLVATAFLSTGCAVGFMTPPVSRQFVTTPANYASNFDGAVKALSSVGKVTNADKSSGLIVGETDLNVNYSMQLNKNGQNTFDARLVGQRVVYGVTLEQHVDQVLGIVKAALK